MAEPHGRGQPPTDTEARGLCPRAFTAKRRTQLLGSDPPGQTPGLVPDFYFSIKSVALNWGLAECLDEMHELFRRGAVRRTCRGDDVLLDHHGAHVVGAEAERDLTDLHPLRHPRRLD